MKISEQLNDAYSYVMEHGWRQGVMGDRYRGDPCCLIGSLTPEWHAREQLLGAYGPAWSYVRQAITELYDNWPGHVATWNDLDSTSEEMVLDVLHYAAKLADMNGQ